MTLMQKAITPALTRAHLTAGHDRLAGYVVRAEDVAFATTPAQLFEVHGLGYEGSPFSPYDRSIDVLRFESSPQLQYRDVPGYIVPLWWLRHSRIPPGAELVRIYDDGTSTLLARYGDVGTGWTVTQLGAPRPSLASLSRCVGPVAKWHGAYLEADVVDNGHTVVLALANPPLAETGFHQSPSGRWYRRVAREDVTELFELDLTARWNGLQRARRRPVAGRAALRRRPHLAPGRRHRARRAPAAQPRRGRRLRGHRLRRRADRHPDQPGGPAHLGPRTCCAQQQVGRSS